jgi:hypothetical protein
MNKYTINIFDISNYINKFNNNYEIYEANLLNIKKLYFIK